MQRSAAQGNPISGTFFNVSRANALRTIRSNHSNVYLLSFHDDDYFIGLPDDVFSAVYNFDTCMEPIGLSRNRDKCQLYDPSGFHDDLIDRCIQAQCQYIVCGAPVGSIQLQRQNVNSKVDSSIAQQLDDLRHIFLTPNGVLKKDTQTIYQIIRPCVPSQLTFLLRTCEHDATEEAVCSLHKLIDEFLILLFDSRRFVINMDNAQKLFLSKGGLGIAPSEAITGAAFIESFTLSFNHMCTLVPDLKTIGKQEGSIHYSPVIFRAPRIFALCYTNLA